MTVCGSLPETQNYEQSQTAKDISTWRWTYHVVNIASVSIFLHYCRRTQIRRKSTVIQPGAAEDRIQVTNQVDGFGQSMELQYGYDLGR